MLNPCISLWNYYVLMFKAVSKSQQPLIECTCALVRGSVVSSKCRCFYHLSLQICGNCNCYDFTVSAVINITWTYICMCVGCLFGQFIQAWCNPSFQKEQVYLSTDVLNTFFFLLLSLKCYNLLLYCIWISWVSVRKGRSCKHLVSCNSSFALAGWACFFI